MGWRTVVVTGHCKLEYKLDYLVIRKHDNVTRIHISEIGMLIVDSTSASLTTMMLCELVKHKVSIIFCDEKHNPITETHCYYGSHDTSIKVRMQIIWNNDVKAELWKAIIADKILKQAKHLQEQGESDASSLLLSYIPEIRQNDETNREGHAAKVYFNTLFGKDFTRSKDCSLNKALDYGYGILLSTFNKEIISNGYLTQIGIWHNNQFNKYNLSSDLMETFRILVDRAVIKMNPAKFETDEKYELLDILNKSVLIGGRSYILTDAISIYCKSAFNALNQSDPSLLKFYSNEL